MWRKEGEGNECIGVEALFTDLEYEYIIVEYFLNRTKSYTRIIWIFF